MTATPHGAATLTLTGALAGLLASGCLRSTLPRADGSAAPSKDTVVLVGSLRVVPAIAQHEVGGPNALLLGEMNGNLLATFTRSFQQPYRTSAWPPVDNSDTAWVPMEGTFYIQVPAGRPLYLRGLSAMTNVGRVDVQMPLRVDLRPGDEVVYVGHLHFIRSSPSRVLVKDKRKNVEEDARASGRQKLLTRRWTIRLALPVDEDDAPEDRDPRRPRNPAAPVEL